LSINGCVFVAVVTGGFNAIIIAVVIRVANMRVIEALLGVDVAERKRFG